MIRSEEMQSFVQLVDAGSITRAAERMRIAKSSVSRHLADVEAKLGVQLLKRTTRRMTLTTAGQQFYAASKRMLTELDEIEAAVTAADSALAGRIRIAAPSVFGPRHLGPALMDFAELNPAVEFDVEFNDRQIDVIEEGFDLAIRIARLQDSRLIARRIARMTMLVAASPGYWQLHGKPKRPAELAHHRVLHYTSGRATSWSYRSARGKPGSVRVQSVLQANNGDFLVAAATRGLGVIRQPRFMMSAALEAGLLEPALTRFKWLDLTAYVVYPETRYLPGRVRALIDFLAARWEHAPV